MNTQTQQFIRIDNPEEATHWIPTYDKRYRKYDYFKGLYQYLRSKFFGEPYNIDTRVTLGKPYDLFRSSLDDEVVIIDDLGQDINLWLCHKGYLVKENNT